MGVGASPRLAMSNYMCGARERERERERVGAYEREDEEGDDLWGPCVSDVNREVDRWVFWVIQKYVGLQKGLRESTVYNRVYMSYQVQSVAKKVTKYKANCNGTRESTAYNMVFFGSVKIVMVPIQINLLYIEKSGLSFMLVVNIVQAQD
jgi:hypothetical protein